MRSCAAASSSASILASRTRCSSRWRRRSSKRYAQAEERLVVPHISVVCGCYNEEENVADLHEQVAKVIDSLEGYTFELILIDNASTDKTVERLREIVAKDPRVRVIVNARNFGHIRSPYYALMQGEGDCTIAMASDLQDPPELIREFVKKWEEGYKIVAAIKTGTSESRVMWIFRTIYYRLVSRLAS